MRRFLHALGFCHWTKWSAIIEKDVAMVKMSQLFRYLIEVQTRKCLICNAMQERNVHSKEVF